jgi:hypothetical protein
MLYYIIFVTNMFFGSGIKNVNLLRYNDYAHNSPMYQAFKAEQRLSRSLPDTQKVFYIKDSSAEPNRRPSKVSPRPDTVEVGTQLFAEFCESTR